jgi:hypothetical protein
LLPPSRLGLGLAVHVVLACYDDPLPFYRLAQQFREGHGVVIPRQQMVHWAEHIATWLVPVQNGMWKAMLAGGYFQIDETPVKVLDPEVQGKAARGYLRFYAVPGGDVPRLPKPKELRICFGRCSLAESGGVGVLSEEESLDERQEVKDTGFQ